MRLQTVRRYLRGGNVTGRTLVLAEAYPAMRVHFLHSAITSGLFDALDQPRTRDELIARLGVKNTDLLDALLDFGVAWRELREKDGRYSIRGRRSRALASEIGDPFAAFIEEVVGYHGSVFTHLAERIRGAPVGDYMETTGELVARSSRVGEAPSAAFLDRCLKRFRPRSMLDVGCGSGIFLRQAVETLDGLTAVGVEYSPEAAAHARRNIERWDLGSRVTIVTGDIRVPHETPTAAADLVTLFHNLYYFQPDERPALFTRLRELTAPSGALAIMCVFRGGGRLATNFDVILRSTKGNTPLPDLEATVDALRASGFVVERTRRIVPMEPLYGLVARPANA